MKKSKLKQRPNQNIIIRNRMVCSQEESEKRTREAIKYLISSIIKKGKYTF